MLVLSRQRDETIMIGDDVQVTVVDIRGEKVRLGITAPPHIPVHRKEVYEAIQREGQGDKKVESLAKKKSPEESPPAKQE
jgi:carbon storage regulator